MKIFERIGRCWLLMIAIFVLGGIFASCKNSDDEATTYYTVSFDSNGGSFVSAQKIESGKTARQPSEPTRENYVFVGWYLANKPFNFNTPITFDLFLTAKWQAEEKYYTISYSSEYGDAPDTIKVAENTILTSEHVPILSLDAMVFKGWYNGETKITAGKKITSDLNLVAKWSEYATVSYSSVFETVSENFDVRMNDTLTEANLTSLSDGRHTFLGWFYECDENKNGTGEQAKSGDSIKTDVILYAKWKTATVSFESKFDDAIESITKYAGENLTEDEIPNISKAGYSFDGWFSDSTELVANFAVSENITFTAKWTLLTYTITYHLNGGTNTSDAVTSYTVEDDVTLPVADDETRIFIGWYENSDFSGDKIKDWKNGGKTGDLTLYARWAKYSEIPPDTIVEVIKFMKKSGTLKATGEFSTTLIREINAALKELATTDKNILVTLDLSEVTELTELEEASESDSSYSFYGCSNLEGIILPKTIISIGSEAFSGCSSLTSITVPDSVTSIGAAAFSGCVALEEITLPFVGSSATATTASHDTLFGYIFGENPYTGAVTTKQHIYYESSPTYYLPPNLTRVTITGGEIFQKAFYNCSKITDITIGKNVKKSIGAYAFGNFLPTSVNYLGTLAEWCDIQFQDSQSNPCYCAGKLYIQGQEIKELIIPDDVTKINDYAFYGCIGITSVVIPDSVTSMGCESFAHCFELTSVIIGNGITSIAYKPFSYCTSLESITIPNSVTDIGYYAFEHCSKLTSVTIGDSVSKIISGAFKGCSSLSSVTFSDTTTWYYTSSSNYTDGTKIDSTELEDDTKAVKYLTNAYKDKYWYLYKL